MSAGTTALFDFHLHSCWSYDATASVEYYFDQAEKLGVSHIAVTEHHHMDSIAECMAAARRHPGVKYIPSAELTVSCELGIFDMVCLDLPIVPPDELQKVFDLYHKWQRDCGDAFCGEMSRAGFPYSREDRAALLRTYRPLRTLAVQGATHVQNGLQREYLIREKKYFQDPESIIKLAESFNIPAYPAADVVIPAVKRAGGTVFIAHPHNYFKGCDLYRMDELRERLEFDGIECAHTSVPAEYTPFYRKYCCDNKLLSTAGSDTHSAPEDKYNFCAQCRFACHGGEKYYLDEILERITPRCGQ